MMDHSRSGARCRTRYHVNTVEGALPRHSRGTIRYELDNLGRRLVFVDWDNGMGVPVFPHEIEVQAEEIAQRIKGIRQERRSERVSD
jgi:hypothetical protein